MLSELCGKLAAVGAELGGKPPRMPLQVYRMAAAVVADQSGRAARLYLGRLRNRVVAQGIELAALRDGGRSWAQQRARRLAAFGLVLEALSKPTRRRGRWGHLVMGYSQGMLAAMLHDPFDTRAAPREGAKRPGTPAVTTVFGVHRKGAHERSLFDIGGDAGYFRELVRAGVVYAQQLPAADAWACELWGPSGYPTNRYWLAVDPSDARDDGQILTELRAALFGAAEPLLTAPELAPPEPRPPL